MRDWQVMQGCKSGGRMAGFTIYAGSRRSDKYVCFYDKAAEQKVEGHWVRAELRLKDEQAQGVAALVQSGMPVGQIVVGVLQSSMTVYAERRELNQHRAEVADWWLLFVVGVNKLRLSAGAVVRSVERVYGWVRHQVAPMLAVLAEVQGDWEFIAELIEDGKRRWRGQHRGLIGSTA